MEEREGFDLPEEMEVSEEEQPTVEETQEETEYEVDEQEESDEDVPKPKPQTKKMYTPEEIKRILRDGDFTGIDTSRLSEEGRAVMKAMQSGLTPKLQESAELRRELQEIKAALRENAPKAKPKDIYEAFDQDQEGTMAFVNQRINALIDSGADLHEIEKVREVREQLRERRAAKVVEQAQSHSKIQESVNTLLRLVPDIDKKQFELREFAIEYMGMTPQEVDYETSLQSKGLDAVKMIARINSAYEKVNAGKRAKTKVTKKASKVEQPGGGFTKPTTTKKDLIANAKKTGDWKSVFLAMED